MAPLKVIIIGAGLAGSLLANGLLRNKIDITVYERDDESANRKGYQIRLGAHALAGFKACLSPEQLEYVLSKFGRSGGVVASAPALFDKDLNLQLDLSKFPAYTKSAPINRALLRDLLQAPLRDKGILRYGKDFVRYELLDDGGIRAYFKDGYIDDADILIGADGNVSKVWEEI
jgi:2-polyprenyl-6-methoxyphenol hydroxylase-like FAD-dependent oxidoreductase